MRLFQTPAMWLWATRPRKVMTVVVAIALVAAASAAAAWIVFGGASGQASGKVGTTQVSPAVSLTNVGLTGIDAVTPGAPGMVKANVLNALAQPEVVNELHVNGGGITSDIPACDTSGLSFTFGGPINLAASENRSNYTIGSVTATSNLDPDCSGANLTFNLVGSTTP